MKINITIVMTDKEVLDALTQAIKIEYRYHADVPTTGYKATNYIRNTDGDIEVQWENTTEEEETEKALLAPPSNETPS